MRVFEWTATIGGECIADGYLLANDRDEAEAKLSLVPIAKGARASIDDDICGEEGCPLDENGVAIRWED